MPLKNKINLQSTGDLAQVDIQSSSSINSTSIRSSTAVTSGIEVSANADATNHIGIKGSAGIKNPIQVNFSGKSGESIKIVDSREGLEQTNQWFRDNGEHVNGRPFFIEENYQSGGLVECPANCNKNNVSITRQTIGSYFDNIDNLVANWDETGFTYTAYIDIPDDQVYRAIRVGSASYVGFIGFTVDKSPVTFNIGRYFYYNGQTGEKVFEDTPSILINGVAYNITEEAQNITVDADENNYIYIENDSEPDPQVGDKTKGRFFIYSIDYNAEPVLTYDTKEVAKLEDLNSSIEDFNAEVVQPLSENVQQNSQDISNIQNHIIEIDDDLNVIHTEIGDIQIFQAYSRLPNPGYDYLNKIYRLDGVLYQCVQTETGKVYNFDFDKLSGSSEITDSNVDAVYNEVDPYTPMSDYVTISGLVKLFRNNNNGLKFGSSKQTGYADFDMPADGNLPLTSVKIDVENYSSSKNVHLRIGLQDDDISIILEPSEALSYSFTPYLYGEDDDYWFGLETLDTYETTDEETGESVSIKCDPRALLHTLQLQYGQDAFEWKQLGGNVGDVLSYEEALDILEPFDIVDTNFIVSGSSTIEDNTLELGASAEVDDTAIII